MDMVQGLSPLVQSSIFIDQCLLQKSQQLAQLGIPPSERILLPYILDLTKALLERLLWRGSGSKVGSARPPSPCGIQRQ
jgi:hypothetical protein